MKPQTQGHGQVSATAENSSPASNRPSHRPVILMPLNFCS